MLTKFEAKALAMAWKFLFGLYWLSIIHSVALILPVSAVSGSENQCPGAVSREEFDELRADLRKLVELVAEIKSGQGSNSARQPVSTDEARSRAKRDVGAANTRNRIKLNNNYGAI